MVSHINWDMNQEAAVSRYIMAPKETILSKACRRKGRPCQIPNDPDSTDFSLTLSRSIKATHFNLDGALTECKC